MVDVQTSRQIHHCLSARLSLHQMTIKHRHYNSRLTQLLLQSLIECEPTELNKCELDIRT